MPPRSRTRERIDEMQDDSDSPSESALNEDGQPKSSSTQVRKAQNRLAQREFRLRKQQYVRDLEARVEVLSGDKEDRVELMTLLIRNLLKENRDLRDMVKTMASFVGEGLGSCLPRLGLSAPQLDAILTRADTDTAYEAFLALKASTQMKKDNPGLPLGSPRRRASSGKRKRTSVSEETPRAEGTVLQNTSTLAASPESFKRSQPERQESEPYGSYAYLFPDLDAFANTPVNPNPPLAAVPPPAPPQPQHQPQPQSQPQAPSSTPWGNTYPPQGNAGYSQPPAMSHQQQYPQNMSMPQPTMYAQPFQQSGFGLTLPPSGPPQPMQFPPDYPAMPQMSGPGPGAEVDDAERQRHLRAAVANLTAQEGPGATGGNMTPDQVEERRRAQEELSKSMKADGVFDWDQKTEAVQLITYHLNNFRVNHAYTLPSSLRPTKVQRTIPHEHAIDGLIFPSIRDRMILLRGRYDLVDAFHGMLNEFSIHGQDILDHHNWEVSEKWLKDFRILVDDEVYDITNKWRAQRGEAPLMRSDAGPIPPGSEVGLGLWNRDLPPAQ